MSEPVFKKMSWNTYYQKNMIFLLLGHALLLQNKHTMFNPGFLFSYWK